jgi:hypothetical protein
MEHGTLLGDMPRFTQGAAEGPVHIYEARRVRRYRDFFHESQTYCRYALGFNGPGEQSHGPRADGSGGYQKRQIDTRRTDALRDFFNRRHEPLGTSH